MFGWVSETFVTVCGAFTFFWKTIMPTPSTVDLPSSSWPGASKLEAGLSMPSSQTSRQGPYSLQPIARTPPHVQQKDHPARLSASSSLSSPNRPKRPPTLVLDLDLYPSSLSCVQSDIGVRKPLPAVLANSPLKSPSSVSSSTSTAPRTRTVSNSTSMSTATTGSSWSSNSSSSATTSTSAPTSFVSSTWSYCKKTLERLQVSQTHADSKGKGPASDTPPEALSSSAHPSATQVPMPGSPSVCPTSLDGYVRFNAADGVWVHALAEYDHVHWRMMERALLYPYTIRDGLKYAGECSDWKKNYRTFVHAHSHLNSRERIELWNLMELERYEAELKRCRI